jgi:hypothetical protein
MAAYTVRILKAASRELEKYEIIRKENVILVHSIGHRSEVYQRRK